jgi:hypothetical protein
MRICLIGLGLRPCRTLGEGLCNHLMIRTRLTRPAHRHVGHELLGQIDVLSRATLSHLREDPTDRGIDVFFVTVSLACTRIGKRNQYVASIILVNLPSDVSLFLEGAQQCRNSAGTGMKALRQLRGGSACPISAADGGHTAPPCKYSPLDATWLTFRCAFRRASPASLLVRNP